MGTVREYPIFPHALPFIFEVQDWLDKQLWCRKGEVVTIRQARWISWLISLFLFLRDGAQKGDPEYYYNVSAIYALHEILSDDDLYCDTSELDAALRNHKLKDYLYGLYQNKDSMGKAVDIFRGISKGW